MSLSKGDYLGGVRDVETMRLRCFCDSFTGCWHFRTARGKPQARGGKPHTVWVHGHNKHMTATRAMWLLSTGKLVQPHLVVMRTCESYDCVNPEHLRVVTRQTALRFNAERGRVVVPAAQVQANLSKGAEASRVLTPELRQWLIESAQPGSAVSWALGISAHRVNEIRREHRAKQARLAMRSVFSLAEASNGATWRAAA